MVVSNLKPTKIKGVESDGMLLAAESDAGFAILTVKDEVPDGTPIN